MAWSPNCCKALSIRARSCVTFWTMATIRVPTISSEGTASCQRRPDQYCACDGRAMSDSGMKTITPMASPTHQVSQPIGAWPALSSSAASWAVTPMLGAMVQASRAPRVRVSSTARGVSSRWTGPTKR